MMIGATIVDWDTLMQRVAVGQLNWEPQDKVWCRSDTFTRWNTSYSFNNEVSDLFIQLRERLLPEQANRLELFLVCFCPKLWLHFDDPPDPPQDLDIMKAWEGCLVTLSPADVRSRLSLLDDVSLPDFFAQCYEVHAEAHPGKHEDSLVYEREMVEFFFMWAAAFGQAANKGWGLVVDLN
jgi:hypothetical protein